MSLARFGIFLMIYAFFACSGKERVKKKLEDPGLKDFTEEVTPEPDDVASNEASPPQLINTPAGVRNYRETFETMLTLLGLTGEESVNGQQNLREFFDSDVSSSLLTSNTASEFSGSIQVAITKLAAQACDVAYQDESIRSTVFGEFDYSTNATQFLTPGNKSDVAMNLLAKLWHQKHSPTNPDVLDMTDLMQDLSMVLETEDVINRNNRLRAVLVGACTAALGSANVTIY
jgi:hypothetical protein